MKNIRNLALFVIIGSWAIVAITRAERSQNRNNPQYAQNAPVPTIAKLSMSDLYWNDADSGINNGYPFRLFSGDAAETGHLGKKGGAKCKREIKLGKAATDYVRAITKGKRVTETHFYGYDKWDRRIVSMSIDNTDLVTHLISVGHMKPWPHNGNKALAPKPDWCNP